MSYIRWGHPLEHFKGRSTEYVFHNGHHIEDYGSSFTDNKSLIEMIGTIIRAETGDEKFALKIMYILSSRMGEKMFVKKRDDFWPNCPTCSVEMEEKEEDDTDKGVIYVCPKCGFEIEEEKWFDDLYEEIDISWKDKFHEYTEALLRKMKKEEERK
ncbi:MAG: hypothetical protein JRJ77_19445 [Deltaproteobacteria bacterium]|nr:hypothetical protein [Deltaproteobacteria bacterium]